MSKWIRLYSDEDFTSGLAAALPASGTAVGARYYATDTQVWYSWNGTTWDQEGGGGGVSQAALNAIAKPSLGSYTYNATTTIADPTSGNLRLNSADPSVATTLAIHDTNASGLTVEPMLLLLGAGHFLHFQDRGDETKSSLFQVQGVVNQGSWIEVAITALDAGSGGNITASGTVIVGVIPFASLANIGKGNLAELSDRVLDANFDGSAVGDVVVTVNAGDNTPTLPAAILANLPSSISVTDGTTTVDPCTSIDFQTGTVADAGNGVAQYTPPAAGTGDVSSSESTGTTVNGSLAVFADANGKTIRESNDGTGSPINESALSAIIVTPSAPGVLLYDATGNPVVTASPATSGLPLVGKGVGAIPAFEALSVGAISPTGGTAGQIPKINVGGTAVEWADDTGGTGGGTARTRSARVVNAGGITAGTPITAANTTGTSLIAYTDAADFVASLEVYINGQLMRNAADGTSNYDVYAAGTAASGEFACEFDLVEGDVIQVFKGGGAAAGGGSVYYTSTLNYVAYGPNYVTYGADGGVNDHTTTQPGASGTFADALAGIPITWMGITVPAGATSATVTRVTVSNINGTGAGTLTGAVIKMDASGTKTNLNSGTTTALTTATTWTSTELTIDQNATLNAGEQFGVMLGEFTQTNTGAGAAYYFRITYEMTITG